MVRGEGSGVWQMQPWSPALRRTHAHTSPHLTPTLCVRRPYQELSVSARRRVCAAALRPAPRHAPNTGAVCPTVAPRTHAPSGRRRVGAAALLVAVQRARRRGADDGRDPQRPHEGACVCVCMCVCVSVCAAACVRLRACVMGGGGAGAHRCHGVPRKCCGGRVQRCVLACACCVHGVQPAGTQTDTHH
jgi:hypothetical protein